VPISPELQQLETLAASMQAKGIRRIHTLAWRDLDDPDAGGSEVHADEFMRRWTVAGFDVLHRTSAGVGIPEMAERNGYRVIRRGSRYSVFPRTIVAETARRMGPRDALVEIWNGVPWFSPVWFHKPRITFLHHVHGPMWDQMFPGKLAAVGRALEAKIAPPFYRRTEVVTPSEATRGELVELGFPPSLVTAVDNGVDPFWSVGGERASFPTIIAVGRQAPVKRFDLLLEAALIARETVSQLELILVGDGPQRPELEAWVRRNKAERWVRFVGRVSNEQLRDHYRRAWVVASASLAEGWGLTLTEAAACGTPAVATDISGHRCSVVDGVTGVLAPETAGGLGGALATVLGDADQRQRLGAAAVARAATLTWDRSALGILQVLNRTVS
jgi:glycosyltransferase involved in cell wall biosynthesis